MFPGFQFVFGAVQEIVGKVAKQQQMMSGLLDKMKSYPAKVQGAWIGGDADEFAADVARRLVPKTMELIAALAGMNVNLSKATQTAQSADQKVSKLANQLGDVFSQIL